MCIRQGIFSALLIATSSSGISADDYLLRLEQVKHENASANAATPRQVLSSLESHVTPGRPFYVRGVTDGCQLLLRGVVEKRNQREFTVEFIYERAKLRVDPAPRESMEGRAIVQLTKAIPVGDKAKQRNSEVRYELSIHPLVPEIGFRDVSSGFAVQLIDDLGRPVANAEAWLGQDPDHEDVIIGPVSSDADGLVRMTEGRESLPTLAFFARHHTRKLMVVANLNRSRVVGPGFGAGKPMTVTITQPGGKDGL